MSQETTASGGKAAACPLPSGIWALAQLAAFHQKPVDPEQLLRAFGLEHHPVGVTEVLLTAKELHLKAQETELDWEGFSKLRLPAIAELQCGDFVIVGQMRNGRLPVTACNEPRVQWHDRETWAKMATGSVILVNKRLSLDNPNRPFGLAWFLPVLWKYRLGLAEVLAAAFLFQLLGIGLPLFIQVIIDKVFVYNNYSTLVVVSAGMLLVILFEGLFGILQSVLLAHAGNRVDVTLGSAIYRHLVRIPLRYFELRRVGDTIARVRELERIRSFLTGQALLSVVDALFIFVYIGILLWYSAALTSVVIFALLVIAATVAVFRAPLRQVLEERFDTGADSQAFLVESVSGMETVKAMALEASMVRRWEHLLARYVTASYRADRLNSLAGGLGRSLQNLATLAILWFGAGLVLHGQLTVGALIAFQMIARQAMAPFLRATSLWQQFQQVGIGIKRLGDLMNAPTEPVLDPNKSSLPRLKGHIRFEHVSFRYHPDAPRNLEDVNFVIRAGMKVGIVGRSGSGKSTLAKLMQRLYVPESGRVLVDGYDLLQVDPAWLRRQIAVVPQESFLFGGTIRENISVRVPGAAMAKVIEAARLAGAHDFIAHLPEGYDTPVGERGTALSGGQRQRIAIARALLTDPRILILDEATSALDYESEHIIQDNLARICEGRTVVLVAHRLSMLRHADLILVMDQGQIVESGTHDALVTHNGLYRHLYLQQGLAA